MCHDFAFVLQIREAICMVNMGFGVTNTHGSLGDYGNVSVLAFIYHFCV